MTEPTRWSGTGHRVATRRNPDGLTELQLQWAREQARHGLHRLSLQGPIEVWSGMSSGWDMVLAAAAFELQIPFIAHIPFLSQPMLWPPRVQAEWIRLRSVAADEVIYGENPSCPEEWNALFRERNLGLLKADALLALWNGKRRGGTWHTVNEAQNLGLPGIHLDPATRKVRRVEHGGWF